MRLFNIRHIATIATAVMVALSCSDTTEQIDTPPTSEGRITLDISSPSQLFSEETTTGESSVHFKTMGGDITIDVVTNAKAWSFNCDDAEWLTLSSDEYFLYIEAAPNLTDERRNAVVTITAGENEKAVQRVLHITQNHSGNAEIALAVSKHNFKAHTDLTHLVKVTTNVEEWSFDTTCSWLFVERTDEGLLLRADSNATHLQRSATIEVTAGVGDDKDVATLNVSQDGTAYIELSSHNVATDDDGGTRSVAVVGNPELEWHVENASAEWFTATKDANNVVISVNSNVGGNQRIGSVDVVIGDEDNSARATINIRQIGPDTEELIYEIEITVPNTLITAAPVITVGGGGHIVVDWGDGTDKEEFSNVRGKHTYTKTGLYTITITGEAKSLKFGRDNEFSEELRNVISWGKLGYTSAADMCLGCSRLEYIPNDVAGSFANVKSFNGAFSCCASLKEIPAGLFRYATEAKRFEDCFSHSASISEIPATLFENCSLAEDFSYAFYATGTGVVTTSNTLSNFDTVREQVKAGILKSIPEELFANCANAKQYDYVFGATAIETIPETLFKSAANATTFMGAFSACVNLKSIPTGLLANATSALDIKYMFAGCESLTEIQSGIFTNNSTITNLEYIFYKTGVTSLQSGIFEGLTSVKTIGAVFQDCKQLTTVEEGLFDGLTSAKSFRYCFADCTALRSIPEGLLRGMSSAYEFTYMFHNTALESVPAGLFAEARDYSSADFTYMFSECANLKTVPAGLFDRFTKVTSPGYKNLFDSSGIETIPAGLFANSTSVSSGFESVFENCPKLQTIEGSIFPATTSVSSIAYAFCNCPMLESIPEDLFAPFGDAKLKFTATFAACSSLKIIPEKLFANNPKVKQFSETFADCTSLESIPEKLLAACTEITTVKGMFHGCTSLATIPADLFSTCVAITSFETTFAECSSLKSIPEELFHAIGTKTSSITFSECFAECTSLESIPASLFDTVRRINYIDSCFTGCVSLTGESPYTLITAEDGTERKVHLYERERGDDFPNAPVSKSAHAECFAGCTGLTDYEDMPDTWR